MVRSRNGVEVGRVKFSHHGERKSLQISQSEDYTNHENMKPRLREDNLKAKIDESNQAYKSNQLINRCYLNGN